MIREYKFKVWDKTLKQWCKFGPWISFDNPEFEILQYTGLKDSKGTEIYDGDIVKINSSYLDSKYYIEFNPRTSAYTASGFPLNTNVGRYLETRDLIVIGNVYEKKESDLKPKKSEKNNLKSP